MKLLMMLSTCLFGLTVSAQELSVPFEGHDPSGPVLAENGYMMEYVGSVI